MNVFDNILAEEDCDVGFLAMGIVSKSSMDVSSRKSNETTLNIDIGRFET